MVQLTLTTVDGTANLYIDVQDGSVGLTVMTDKGQQYDFDFEKEEWPIVKNFIENQLSAQPERKEGE